jgi:hypothetical protein
MRMRRYRALVIALVVVGCDVHRLLEAPPPPYIRLSLALAPASLTVSRGGELTFTATVTRTGEDHGPVTVSLDTPPVGITAETQSSSTSGDVTTATIVVKAATDAPVGDYSVTVRGRANEATDGTSVLILHVISPPAYSLTLSKQSLTIARGGIDRIGLALERTNLSSPITLSVTGQAGISGTFDPNPLTNDSTNATIAVGVDIAPGTYNVSLRGSVAGVPDRTAPLTVNVVADALQVITASSLSSPQLSTAATEIIVNAAAASGVSLSAEGLPSGVTASFDPLSSGNQATKLRLDVAGTAPAGTYTVTVRAKASGVPDATSTLAFNILPATIGLAATPKAANLFAGNSVIASLAVSRSNFSGSVALSADALPSGITATFDSATIKGGSAAATITAAPTVAPGTYAVNLRATPAGLAADAAQSAAVAITVVPPPTTGANVVLDWSKCAAPDWLAVQDGAGPWTRVSGSGGIFSGAVSSAVGGIAWVENGTTTVVRYMTHAELVSRPLDMCGLSSGPRSLSGSATHGSPTEQGTYSLGGGTGLSSGTQPRFTITGARDGVHDLLAYTTFQGSAPTRVILRRDININAATDTIDPVNFQGSEAFAPVTLSPGITVNGTTAAGETFSNSTMYLTTAACTANFLYAAPGTALTGAGSLNFSLSTIGFPAAVQRPSDYYLVTVLLTSNGAFRSSSIAFHAPASRSLTMAPPVPAPTVTSLAGGYKRLQATFDALPAVYNRTVTLQYTDALRSMTVSGTAGYGAAAGSSLVMPDLSPITGWPTSASISTSASGQWRFTMDGNTSSGSSCVENRVSYLGGRTGTY